MRYRGHGAIELNGERVAEADYVATLRASGGHRKWFIDFTSLDGELGPHEIYTLDLRERVRLTLGSMALPVGVVGTASKLAKGALSAKADSFK